MSLPNVQAEVAEAILENDQQSDLVHQSANLQIYYSNVTRRLINKLQETYPLIQRLLGEAFFQLTVNEYIMRYPSRSSNLNDYGAYFSDFLAEYQPLHDLMYLAEVAMFEWTCHQLQFAADATPLDDSVLDQLTTESYENLYFDLHPASALMKCHYPMLEIIDLCQGEIDDLLDINAGGINLLLIRRDSEIISVKLNEAEYQFLNEIQHNRSVAEASATALHYDPTFQVAEKLASWVRDNTLIPYA